MTTKQMMINRIEISRPRRGAWGDLLPLARSMEKEGVILPAIITPYNRLLAGERRVRAAAQLGWTAFPVAIVKDLPEAAKRLREAREETTCAMPMTYTEIMRVSLDLRELDKPFAAQRKAEGAKQAWRVMKGAPSERRRSSFFREHMDDALGFTGSTFNRLDVIFRAARDEDHPRRALACKLLNDIDLTGRISHNYEIFQGRAPLSPEMETVKTVPTSAQVVLLRNAVHTIQGVDKALEGMRVISDEMAPSEAVACLNDLIKHRRLIEQIIKRLRELT